MLTLEAPVGSLFCRFSPDGKTLAAGSRNGIQLWRAPSFEEIPSAGPMLRPRPTR
jgi:hypothetical protein